MEGRNEALLLWLQQATRTNISSYSDLISGELLLELVGRVEGLPQWEGSQQSEGWRAHYARLRWLYEQTVIYLKQTLKMPPPSTLSTMNMVEMAKGQADQGVESLLHLVFITCIESNLKQESVGCIMQLPSSAQMSLMSIVQEVQPSQQEEKENSETTYLRQAYATLEFQYNNLTVEFSSLNEAHHDSADRAKKAEEVNAKLKRENDQLRKEVIEKSEQLRNKEEILIDKYAEQNDDLVEELKRTIIEQEQQFSQQARKYKDEIEALKEQISQCKESNSQLIEEQQQRSLIQARDEHANMVPIAKYKAKVNELLTSTKEFTQKEINLKRENVGLKNRVAQLESKVKKLDEESSRRQRDMLISESDSSKLKLDFFSRVRDGLKARLTEAKEAKNNKAQGSVDMDSVFSEEEY